VDRDRPGAWPGIGDTASMSDGKVRLTREIAERQLRRGKFFWIDLHRPTADEFAVLGDVFRFHPVAIENSKQFGQRPKLEDYDDFVFLVVYGAVTDEDRIVEVHCFYSERFLVTVHVDPVSALDDVRRRYDSGEKPTHDAGLLLYRIVDTLVDSFFPVLAEFDDRFDNLADKILLNTGGGRQQEIFAMKRQLARIRKVVVPQREVFASVTGGDADLPGMTREAQRYFRAIHDHLVRLSDQVESYRELLTSAMQAFLSTVSNQQNVVMKQLTVISTIFLPLTFVTGFFGQNFGWMVDRIGGWPAFVLLGIGAELVAVAMMVVLFKRRGWSSDT
jgi:magnesium transporter